MTNSTMSLMFLRVPDKQAFMRVAQQINASPGSVRRP